MDSLVSESKTVPSSAQTVVNWIMWNSPINRDTIKEILLSQQFPYIEDECLWYLQSQLLSNWKISEIDLARLRGRIASISSIRTLQKGFIKKAIAVLDTLREVRNES